MKLADGDHPPKKGTYWVVPGKLLAGPFPGSADPDGESAAVGPLLDAGITTFLNLMEPTETNHSGDPFTPYEAALGPRAAMLRRPITDLSIPSREDMIAILDDIDAAVANGAVYVHCWGGVGRTGTVVGCWLLRHGYAVPSDVIDTIQSLRQVDPVRGHRLSPETDAQRRFVVGWSETK
jgi:hypothetical protein